MRTSVAIIACILLAGCGGSIPPSADAHTARPIKALQVVSSPYVEFVGGSLAMGIVAQSSSPQWKCTTCRPGEISSQALSLEPQIAALKPDVVWVVMGEDELTGPMPSPGPPPPPSEGIPLANIQQLTTELTAAGIPVVVANLPPLGGANGEDPQDLYRFNLGLEAMFMDPVGYPWTVGVELADYYDAANPVMQPPTPFSAGWYDDLVIATEGVLGKLNTTGAPR